MRTTLEIDDDLMEALLARHPGASKRQAVEEAIRTYLEREGSRRARDLVGRIEIEDDSEALRAADRRA